MAACQDFIEHVVHNRPESRSEVKCFAFCSPILLSCIRELGDGHGDGQHGQTVSLDVEAESTYDAAHLFLTKAKEHIIREPLPIPSCETTFEVTVNGESIKVSGTKLQRWIMKRREEWKGPRGLLFKQRPVLGP